MMRYRLRTLLIVVAVGLADAGMIEVTAISAPTLSLGD